MAEAEGVDQTMLPDQNGEVEEVFDVEVNVETTPGFTASMKYIVKQFLEERHFMQLHKAMSNQWDRGNSLEAAMKLMKEYGVVLPDKEIEKLKGLDEAKQIECLVMKMPQQSNEQFQHFFLKLQLIVNSAQVVKRSLEEGRPDLVESALDEAESTGIAPFILKMAIVQAGSEVKSLRQQYELWLKETDSKLARLIHGQDDAIQAQKRLAVAQAQLTSCQGGANEKTKKVLMGFAAGNSKAMLASTFQGWSGYVKSNKEEMEIKGEYIERIEAAENRLIEFKSKQLENVRSVLMKKAREGDMILLQAVLKVFQDSVDEARFEKENGEKIRAMEEQLASFKSSQAENTKAVLGRMAAQGDAGLMDMCLKAWINFRLDYLKDKEANDAVMAAEKRVQAFMKSHQENAKTVMDKMSAGTDSGLQHTVMTSWVQQYLEDKKEKELEEALNSVEGKFSQFGARNQKNARSVMERARLHLEEMVMRRHMNAWRLHSRMEGTLAQYQAKIEAKKQQLFGVQQMFRNFAQQLEAGMKDQDSARELYKKRTMTMSKSEGAVSLPDIHSGRGGTPKSSGRARQAWAS